MQIQAIEKKTYFEFSLKVFPLSRILPQSERKDTPFRKMVRN